MHEREDSHTESIPGDKLSPEYASKLLFASFRFSQGSAPLQRHIFGYLHAIRPHWALTSHDFQEVDRLASNVIRKFVLPSERQSQYTPKLQLHSLRGTIPKVITEVIDRELNNMKIVFNRWPAKVINLVPPISRGIIDADFNNLSLPTGRERIVPAGMHHTTYSDPFLSHYYYFGIEGNTTGFAEYDQMFQEVTEFVKDKDHSRGSVDQNKVVFIRGKYLSTH